MQSAPQQVSPGARASAPQQSLVITYLIMLAYMLLALLARLVALSPLYALYAFPADSPLRYLALLCPLLVLCVILPLRFSFAQALVRRKEKHGFSMPEAFSFASYGEKLGEGVWHALHVFVWSLPLLAALVYAYLFQNNNDVLTLLNAVKALGATVTSLGCGVANFFTAIFGGEALTPTGGIVEGLYALLAMAGLCVLILLFGAMRNSAYRYIWVSASRDEKNPHVEARRRLRGRRLRQLGAAAINLVLWLPFLYALATVGKQAFSDAGASLTTALMTKTLDTSALTGLLKPVLIAFFALYLPLLPVRRFITERFATAARKPGASAREASQTPPVTSADRSWMDDVPTTSSGSPAPTAGSQQQPNA